MAELRKLTSRGEITPTRLTNVYHYGSFRGDPVELLETSFDAHVYEANWGSRTLMFGFPRTVVDLDVLKAFEVEAYSEYQDGLTVAVRGSRAILTLSSSDEDAGGWIDEEDSARWLSSMVSLREAIVSGDFRALYLGWLAGATLSLDSAEDEDEDDPGNAGLVEPPVPPGLGQLTPALKTLVTFLRLDEALVDVAAETSAPLQETRVSETAIRGWLARLPAIEKDDLLFRLIRGEARLGAELVRRLRNDLVPQPTIAAVGGRRTASELLTRGQERAIERAQQAKAEEGRKRAEYLDSLARRQPELWQQADWLADQKKARDYDESVTILADLHDLAQRQGAVSEYERRLTAFRERHARKPALMDRLRTRRLIV